MAVDKFSEKHELRRTVQVANTVPPETKKYRGFLVTTDDKADGEEVVLTEADTRGFTPGAPHDKDVRARLVKRSALPFTDEMAPKAWRLILEYTTNYRDLEDSDDPLSFRTDVTQGSREFMVPHVVDAVTGQPLLNAAGDPPDPPLMMEISVPTLTVKKNFGARPLLIEAFRNTVNNAAITVVGKTYPANTFRLKRHEVGDELLHNLFPYYTLTAEFEVDPAGFNSVWLNDGLNELVLGNPALKQPICLGGEPVERPVPLYANGAVIPATALPGAANLRSAARYTPADYSALGLPAS